MVLTLILLECGSNCEVINLFGKKLGHWIVDWCLKHYILCYSFYGQEKLQEPVLYK